MKISKNFTLEEIERSDIAKENGIYNKLPTYLLKPVKRLINRTLQPLRNLIDEPIFITSGYRSNKLNDLIGGVSSSKHTLGMAVDIISKNLTIQELQTLLKNSNIPFTKAINENDKWLHLSFTGENTRLCYYTKDYLNYTRV